jgi:hypothetical protein
MQQPRSPVLYDEQAEKAILGAMMLEEDAIQAAKAREGDVGPVEVTYDPRSLTYRARA